MDSIKKINFKCKRCNSCCKDSNIRVSPYDILRICKRLEISSVEFHKKYSYIMFDSENKNLLTCMLQTTPKCPFLEEQGCTIYEDRPFGCRVYPVGIVPLFDGKTLTKTFKILKNCSGIGLGQELQLQDYQKNQNIDEIDIYDPWIKFKIACINKKLPQDNEFYSKFLALCYDFDGDLFKEFLKYNKLDWPEDINDKYDLIVDLINRLIQPFEIKSEDV